MPLHKWENWQGTIRQGQDWAPVVQRLLNTPDLRIQEWCKVCHGAKKWIGGDPPVVVCECGERGMHPVGSLRGAK